MRGLLPSVWLFAAALCTGSVLSLIDPFSGDETWPEPAPVNEMVVAKQFLAVVPQSAAQGEPSLVLAAAVTTPKVERRDEWVQVAGYTTMVRSRPSPEAPPLYAYAVGRPLRVIAREGRYVRVQDLGSGKLGWVEEVSLIPFFGGYRQREPQFAEPQVAAVTPQQATVAAAATLLPSVAEPQAVATRPPVVAAKKVRQSRNQALAARPGSTTAAVIEPGSERGLFRKKRGVQRVALAGKETGFVGMIGRAFRGF
jgi:hypothetical protein